MMSLNHTSGVLRLLAARSVVRLCAMATRVSPPDHTLETGQFSPVKSFQPLGSLTLGTPMIFAALHWNQQTIPPLF